MKRRTKIVLLVAGLAVAIPVASVVVLTKALAMAVDPRHYCESGFSTLVDCHYRLRTQTVSQGTPNPNWPSNATSATPSGEHDTPRTIFVDATSWGVVDCPKNYLARRVLCAAATDAGPVQAAGDDPVTGLPRPKPWLVTTAKNSSVIMAFHVETPLDLAGVLGFYRTVLSKRGWSENDGAVVGADGAVIPYTTSNGPALLRLTRQGDRTMVDLSLRKPAVTNAGIKPTPGQVRLLLGNATKEEAVLTINGQTIEVAAGRELMDDPIGGKKSPDSQEINLPPGKYKISIKLASGAAQNREFDLAADETWGLVAGQAGVPLPLRFY
jgi:hypothetical protein